MLGQLLQKLASTTLLIFDSATTSSISSGFRDGIPARIVRHEDQQPWVLMQSWGQYSPWFNPPSEISATIPPQCDVTFAQVLSRHGSRDPTYYMGDKYKYLIDHIHCHVDHYPAKYRFLKEYQYDLGYDQLTPYGRKELTESGARFQNRYRTLSMSAKPFIRASGEARVIMSARNWTWGYYQGNLPSHMSDLGCPTDAEGICIISELAGSNNTLSQGGCWEYKNGSAHQIAAAAKTEWMSRFVPPIQERLNADLPGAKLNQTETVWLMDLCPFNTVADTTTLTLSPFCSLFNEEEWRQYGYLQSLDKYYGHGGGNPWAPTMGVGYVNELIARLTDMPVKDHTTTNCTLDHNNTTFPLKRKLYADFSHDNDMSNIFFALQLYPGTKPLSNTSVETVEQTNGWSAAYTVPFAARMYVEKLECTDSSEEMVRVLMNERVLPLEKCGGDALGRCTLSKFVDSLSFAVAGGRWKECPKPA